MAIINTCINTYLVSQYRHGNIRRKTTKAHYDKYEALFRKAPEIFYTMAIYGITFEFLIMDFYHEDHDFKTVPEYILDNVTKAMKVFKCSKNVSIEDGRYLCKHVLYFYVLHAQPIYFKKRKVTP